MELTKITDQFYISPQIAPEDTAALAADGFTMVVCNRPDDEQPGQPSASTIAAVAEASEMSFAHIPMSAAGINEDMLDSTHRIVASGAKTLAYCRSGRRSSVLWAAVSVRDGAPMDDVIRTLTDAGLGTDSEWRQLLGSMGPQ